MDWLLGRQKAIEAKLARRHLAEGVLVLYDVSSRYYEGEKCPLARRGHDRDGKTGRPIIVYGVLTDGDGRPVAVQVYPGDTGDPTTVPDQVAKLEGQFGLSRVVLVGDRGMLTQTQINTLKEHPGLGWISALRSPAIRDLLTDGHLNRSLFDQVNLAEIASPDFPGERLIACYNPLLAEKRQRKRAELLAATEANLAKLARGVALRTATPLSAAEIGVKAGRGVGRGAPGTRSGGAGEAVGLGAAEEVDASGGRGFAGPQLSGPACPLGYSQASEVPGGVGPERDGVRATERTGSGPGGGTAAFG